jgi:hypothetical protein
LFHCTHLKKTRLNTTYQSPLLFFPRLITEHKYCL